ncbi:MAG: methyl-accepting chemotaxis protein [Fibrobacterales bacterium]
MKLIKKIPLAVKLIVVFILAGLGPLMYTADKAIELASNELEMKAFAQLESIQTIKSNQIKGFFSERIGDIEVLSTNPSVIEAAEVFGQAYFQSGLDGEMWRDVEKKYSPWLTEYMDKYGYYDLFVISEKGDIIYTVAKESDFGQNILRTNLASSPIGVAFNKAVAGKSTLSDFAPYAPSNDEPAGFVAAPIYKNDDLIGVVALQISTGAINAIMQERAGLGETGETYLVGSDKLMRSDSYLDPVNHSIIGSFKNPLKGSVDTEATREGLAGVSGKKIIIDYNGNPVLSVYSPVKIKDVTWVLIAEIDEAEAFHVIEVITSEIISSSIWVIVVLTIIAGFMTFSIARPIKKIFKGLKTLSASELETTSDTFRGIISNLTSSSNQVNSASGQLANASQQLSEGASQQSSSIEEISSSLEEVAAMSRQNSSNSNESKKLAESARGIVNESIQSMNSMTLTMDKIQTSSDQTVKIIKTIDEIAFQTNLLALNAAVEAARAGDAGKGFAVVAEEVRNLAQRSAEAAKNTSTLIEESKQNSDDGVRAVSQVSEAMNQINEAIGKVSQLINEVAAASGEQTKGVDQVNEAITQLNQVTQSNAANSEETAAASEELNGQAAVLQSMVNEMLIILENRKKDTIVTNTAPQYRPAKKSPLPLISPAKRSRSVTPVKEIIPFDDDELKNF